MRNSILFTLLIVSFGVSAQDINERYKQADSFRKKYDSLYRNQILSVNSINDSNNFWYLVDGDRGKEFVLVQTDKKKCTPAFDREKLANSLKSSHGKEKIKANDLPFRNIEFNKSMDTISFTIEREQYFCSLKNYQIIKKETSENRANRNNYWGNFNKGEERRKVLSPDKKRKRTSLKGTFG